MINNTQDYRSFNNINNDNTKLKSITILDDETLQHVASLSITAKNDNDKNNSNNNDDDDDDFFKDDNDDNAELKTYSNLDLTRQVLQKVREYMKAEKMSMSEFARQTGVSKAWLSKLKHTDANLSLNTAQDLLHYMGYTLRLTREGSATISKSRIKKYACRNLMKEDAQLYVSLNDKNACKNIVSVEQTKYITADSQQIQHIAEGQQIAPTPSSTQQTQTSTITNSVSSPAPTTAPTPVKLNPGQTVTISAGKNVEQTSVSEEPSVVKQELVSASKEIGSLSALAKQAALKNLEKKKTKQQKIVSRKINTNTLNDNEIDLLYKEDFFSTPLGSLNKK